jgi:ferredoxin-type protein NapG
MSEPPHQHPSAAEHPTASTAPSTNQIEDAPAPVTRVPPSDGDGEARRDFFSEALREALAPFAGIIERRINPLLAALEAIPDQVERFTQSDISLPVAGSAHDQPHTRSAGNAAVEAKPAPSMRFLRPPGAVPPGEFESLCNRCGKCVEVCPAHAIIMDSYALETGGLPAVVPATQPCVVCSSLACMSSCPTGALRVVEAPNIKMGTARVDRMLCRRESGEDCRSCVEACPIDGGNGGEAAIFIHQETGRIRVRKNVCIGCGLCENRCPTNPQAIFVEPYRAPVDPIVA